MNFFGLVGSVSLVGLVGAVEVVGLKLSVGLEV
jgi:hypothetical protein